jgi:hypothetical protein
VSGAWTHLGDRAWVQRHSLGIEYERGQAVGAHRHVERVGDKASAEVDGCVEDGNCQLGMTMTRAWAHLCHRAQV